MVMYKQNQGLMAKGTVGTQTTGGTTMPKKPQSYNLQSINFGGMSASGRPSVGSQIWGALNPINWNLGPSAGTQPTPKPPSIEQQAPQPTTSAQRTELSQPEIMDLINNGYIYTARGMSNEGLRIAYDKMMSDRRAAQGRMSAPQAPQQQAQPVQAQQVITPEFRMPTTSPYANIVNPYGTDYRTGLMSRVSGQTARQFTPQREQLEANLAARGISRESPLFQSMMAQQEAAESGARLQAVSAAEEAGLQAAANWEMQRAQGEADWLQSLQLASERLARQPLDIQQAEQEVESARIRNKIDRARASVVTAPESIRAELDKVLRDAELGEIEVNAARDLYERSKEWLNSEGGRFAREVLLELIRGGFQLAGRAAGGAGGGK